MIYPLAFGFANSECSKSWTWFLKQLHDVILHPELVLIVSDRHTGISNGMRAIFPNSAHVLCAYHFANNLKQHCRKRGDVIYHYYRAAYAYRVEKFDRVMAELKSIHPKVYDELVEVEPCDVCGGIGSADKIVTCFHCEKARQHVYCLQVLLFTILEIWFCEACRPNKGIQSPKPVAQELHHETSTSHEVSGEAIKLSLGSQKVKLSSLNVAPNCNLLGQGGMEIHSVTQRQVSLTSTKFKGGIFHADVHSKGLDIKEINLKRLPKCEMYNSFSSTSGATWCFEIINMGSSCKFYDGFHAFLPRKVHCKTLKFSEQMPGVLLCSLLPRSHIYLELFQNDSPNMDDTEPIFFPGNFQTSKEQYVSLLGIMEMQDLVLKSCVDGFELLIFSSKSLNANSIEFKLGSFLWGLYRNVKGNPAVSLRTYDVESCNVRNEINSAVKTEPYDHPDVPPGFPRRAADATAAR
ncbi:hypothetical protein LWI29_008120 [Acer saccharum]|uniref:Zinc finger PHD-type domain-containing protein n=1 Tax=Acer saccharum TaxID=4024 RepID=A0AA39S6E1_ACESA|nr:hypothetical protein LWI29_008120 [Acer saccharum]